MNQYLRVDAPVQHKDAAALVVWAHLNRRGHVVAAVLVQQLQAVYERTRPDAPAQLPTSGAERLARAADSHSALPHARQRR